MNTLEGVGTIKRHISPLALKQGHSPPISDAALIAACLEGDLPSWDALIARYQSFIYTLTFRLGVSSPDAEDIFQNVCIRLFQHLGELRDASRLASWLAAITRQEVWGLARRPSSLPLSGVVENERTSPTACFGAQPPLSPEDAALRLEQEQIVRLGLQDLSEPCRELLSLLYGEASACSYADAAARLALPVGSIGPKRARCLEQLKKILAGYGY